MNDLFIFLFLQNIVYMDMDSGDARKESIEGSDAMSLQGAGNSQHNHVEEVISHNKPKKDANLHVIPQGIFYIIINIFFVILPLYSTNLAFIVY